MRTKQLAEKWTEEYLNSEEGKAETAKTNKEFLEMMLYGTITVTEELSVNEIVERYKEFLTEKDIENLNKLRDGNSLDI